MIKHPTFNRRNVGLTPAGGTNYLHTKETNELRNNMLR